MDLEEPDRLALVAERVDDVLGRAGGRAEADEHALGVLEPVGVDELVPAAGEQRELAADLLDHRQRRLHRRLDLVLELEVVVRHRERPLRRHPAQVEQRIRDRVLADERAHLGRPGGSATGSAECVIVKPSWQTSTGRSTSGCSAMRGAMTIRS